MFPFTAFKKRWHHYWFSEESVVGFAVFRIVFGFILLLYHLPRVFYISELYTKEGFLFPDYLFFALGFPIPTFFFALLLNLILYIAIFLLIIGYKGRASSVIIFLVQIFLLLLENFSTRGYGRIIVIYSFLLLFAPDSSFLSLDYAAERYRQIRDRLPKSFSARPPKAPITVQHLALWQLLSIYFFNVITKLKIGGTNWFSGEYLLNFYRDTKTFGNTLVVYIFEQVPLLLPILGMSVIYILSFLVVGLLIPRYRNAAIMLGIVYHSVALITSGIPYVFSFLMLSLYLLAVEPKTWYKWWHNLEERCSESRIRLFYDGDCQFCKRSIALVGALDFCGKIEAISVFSLKPEDLKTLPPVVNSKEKLLQEVTALTPSDKVFRGLFAFRYVLKYLPHGWLLLPLFWLPGASWFGVRVYKWIAFNRYGSMTCNSCGNNK